MKLPNLQQTFYALCVLLSILLGFHVLVLLRIIPYDMVWGGRLANEKAMYTYESVALVMTIFFGALLYIRYKALENRMKNIVFIIMNWLVFIYFTFNIFGNLASGSTLEKIIFTPTSILLSLFTLRLALYKK